MFQSPLGEVVKETLMEYPRPLLAQGLFQSPLGEAVKETRRELGIDGAEITDKFQSPLGEVVKQT